MSYTTKYDKVMMKTALIWAEMSYCERAKVGAVIAKNDRIISIGYNGTMSGSENKCEDTYIICPVCDSDRLSKYDDIEFVCNDCSAMFKEPNVIYKTDHSKVIHAEMNAILFCAKNGISTKDTTLYVTLSPCAECAKAIIQAGIKRVVYHTKYRDVTGLFALDYAGIIVEQVEGV